MNQGRTAKRRSARACRSCRERKVRCDLLTMGAPCTNCRLDSVECILAPNKRRRVIRRDINTSEYGHLDNSMFASALEIASVEVPHSMEEAQMNHDEEIQNPLAETQQAISPPVTKSAYMGATRTSSQSFSWPSKETNGHLEAESPHTGVLGDIDHGRQHTDSASLSPKSSLMADYIMPLAANLSTIDLEYLSRKGALALPPVAFRNTCLCRYIEFVHPVLPLIDLNDFVTEISHGSNGGRGVSLLLLSAVIFAAVPFVETEHITSAGYASKLAARTELYKQAKLLYDLNAEDSKLVMVQAAMLLSTPHGEMEHYQDSWYWVGTAITFAQSLGLHLDVSCGNLDRAQHRLRRRVWWCCCIREHIVAMGLGKPSRITHQSLPMLSVVDFDISPLSDDLRLVPLQSPVARDTMTQLQLAVLCIEKARLCVCIHRIISTVYATPRPHGTEVSLANSGYGQAEIPNQIARCVHELETWKSLLPREAVYKQNLTDTEEEEERSLTTSRAMLHTIYHTATCALFRTQSHKSSPSATSRLRLRMAAQEMTSIFQGLQSMDLMQYLDATGVANVIAATIIHLQDCRAREEVTRKNARHYLQKCIGFLQILKNSYGSAVHAMKLFEPAASLAATYLPSTTGTNNTARELQQGQELVQPLDILTSTSDRATPLRYGHSPVVVSPDTENDLGYAAADLLSAEYLDQRYWQALGSDQLDAVWVS